MKVYKEKTRDQERFVEQRCMLAWNEHGKTSSITLHCVLPQYGKFLVLLAPIFLAPREAMFNISSHIYVAYNQNAEVFNLLPPPPHPSLCAWYASYKS